MIIIQIRAARAALRWTLDDASNASGVHRNTISNVEKGSAPSNLVRKALEAAYEEAGAVITETGLDFSGSPFQPARAALRWTLDDASNASGVHRNTISNVEKGSAPSNLVRKALEAAYEEAGAVITETGLDFSGVASDEQDGGDHGS